MSEVRTIRSLGIARPGEAYFLDYEEAPPNAGEVRIETLFSGFSAGTELTFLKGTNPFFHSRWDLELGVFVAGEASTQFPVPFLGYMETGRVVESLTPAFRPGDIVGSTYGHKTGHTANPFFDVLVPLPRGLEPILGIFVGQMGPIAANAILHADADVFGTDVGALGQGLSGRPVLVVGGGSVGLLTALFAKRAGAAEVAIAEPSPFRRRLAEVFGITALTEDEAVAHAKARWHHGGNDRGADFVFQTRAHAGALATALRALRPQGTVIDMAFYQGGAEAVRLGEEFHHSGLAIRAAQIDRVPRGLAPAWDRGRLAHETLGLLAMFGTPIREHMITHVVPIDEAPQFLASLVETRPDFLQVVFKVTA